MLHALFPYAVWITAAGTAMVVAAVWLLMQRRGSSRDGVPAVLRVLAVAGVAGGFCAFSKLMFLRAVDLDPFGRLHVLYADLILVATTLGLLLLMRFRKRGATRLVAWGLGAAAFCIPAAAAYASFIEPYWLTIEHVDVPLPQLADRQDAPVRIAVLADVQTDAITAYEQRVLTELERLAPDLVVLPGDFFQCSPAQFHERRAVFLAWLKQLRAPHGVYACIGNIDYPDLIEPLMAEAGIRLLLDEIAIVHVRDVRLAIGGLRWSSYKAPGVVVQRLADTPADVRLLLAHTPDAVLAMDGAGCDLVVCGHTHGGQVQAPFYGPLLTASRAGREVAGGGLHFVNGQRVYVSRGVGFERGLAPPLRFWCRPEVTLLQLRGE